MNLLELYKVFYSLLHPREKFYFYILQIITFISAFFELVGVAAVVPYLTILMDVENALQSDYLLFLYNSFNFTSTEQFIIYAGLLVLFLLTLGTLLAMFATWGLLRFSFHVGYKLSARLFYFFIHQPWLYHNNTSSSKLIGIITSEVDRVTTGVISPLLLMFSRFSLAILIVITLLIYDPIISSIIAAIFVGAYLTIFSILRQYLQTNSRRVSETIPLRYKYLNEGFGGIREILLLNIQDKFNRLFELQTRKTFLYRAVNNSLTMLPRYFIEYLAFGSLMGYAIFLFYSQDDGVSTITVLLVYAVAAAKLLPSLQQIYFYFGTIQGTIKSFDVVKEHIESTLVFEQSKDKENKLDIESIDFKDSIKLERVSFQYKNKKEFCIKDLNLTIKKGEILGIVGPSGSGKSTIADLLLGIIEPDEGKLFIDNVPINRNNLKSWQNIIGFVPQQTFLSEASIAENIAFGESEEIDEEKLKKAIKRSGLKEFVENLSDGIHSEIGEKGLMISGGQRQRIGIARAFYRESQLIVFDEATNAQDTITEKKILDTVFSSKDNTTFLMIAHRISTIKECTSIAVCDNGEIKDFGSYGDLLERSSIFQQMVKNSN